MTRRASTDSISYDGFDVTVTVTPQEGAPAIEGIAIIAFKVKAIADARHAHHVEVDLRVRTKPVKRR